MLWNQLSSFQKSDCNLEASSSDDIATRHLAQKMIHECDDRYHDFIFLNLIKISLKLIELKSRNALDRNTMNVNDARLLITLNVKIDFEAKLFVDILQVSRLYEQKWWKVKLCHLSCKLVFMRDQDRLEVDWIEESQCAWSQHDECERREIADHVQRQDRSWSEAFRRHSSSV